LDEEGFVGVIDSLSAGYRFLSKRLELILIPIVLDVLLWVTPRLNIAPLFEQIAQFYQTFTDVPDLPADMTTLAHQFSALLEEMGTRSNLLSLLFWLSGSLLHLPSLLVSDPLPAGTVQTIANLTTILGLAVLFSLIGVCVGVIYMSLLARQLPIGEAEKRTDWGQFLRVVLRHTLKILLFLLIVAVAFVILLIPVSIGISLITLALPGLTPVFAFVFGAVMMIVILYLYFVPIGLILDNLRLRTAITQSFRLVRDNFWATLGLILLSDLISAGIRLILHQLVGYQPIGTLVAIAINAFIGSGLAMGLMVFYRSRVLLAEGKQPQIEAV